MKTPRLRSQASDQQTDAHLFRTNSTSRAWRSSSTRRVLLSPKSTARLKTATGVMTADLAPFSSTGSGSVASSHRSCFFRMNVLVYSIVFRGCMSLLCLPFAYALSFACVLFVYLCAFRLLACFFRRLFIVSVQLTKNSQRHGSDTSLSFVNFEFPRRFCVEFSTMRVWYVGKDERTKSKEQQDHDSICRVKDVRIVVRWILLKSITSWVC